MVVQQLDLSLGETEALMAKAARGAGFSWGIAVEIGKAARRLVASDASGAVRFAEFLKSVAAEMPEPHACPVRRGLLRADGGTPIGQSLRPDIEAAFMPLPSLQKRCRMDSRAYECLNLLAARTYAPATAQSRDRGAG